MKDSFYDHAGGATCEKQKEEFLDKNYAELTTTPPTTGRTWYLPQFAVIHPAKLGKVRDVFDAAVRSGWTSFNDHLLPDLDLQQSLQGVLMRFCQHEIAVAADVEEMFL
ncbi:hypothetical protein EVAR_36028_1 [Eumeta japonica]|uniref:Uncharacterized protein n=1 Tax=Eumeta variegata TaxID=151549 RepID=A0A4C1WTK1_EUMVA|nr:hypothetical protein EVAR_36028_1 [Eumeta japonica]